MDTPDKFIKFLKTKKIQDFLQKAKQDALLRCMIYGHDYQNIPDIQGQICMCCGNHLANKENEQ